MKYILESAAAQQISAWAIINKKGERVARVLALYPKDGAGRVTVEVHHIHRVGVEFVKIQQGTACGYGYDKFTAALSGLTIDGIKMMDHCQRDDKAKRLEAQIHKLAKNEQITQDEAQAKARKIGAVVANWWAMRDDRAAGVKDGEKCRVYTISGLEQLTAKGYTVWQVL